MTTIIDEAIEPRRAVMPEMSIATSDNGVLDLLRKLGPLSVLRLAELTQVTSTAVRQRLTRLMAQGMIERVAERRGRGRPSHRYSLTEKGRRQMGANFVDLALALWHEIREIKNPEVRRGLLQRLSVRMAAMYAGQIHGATTEDRMQSVSALLAERGVPFSVERNGQLPILTAEACPYPQLAEQDRGICSLEKMMFSEMLGENVRLTDCRLDGATCCRFEVN
jgi:DeoR family transcriptional regulator, suf operon transcriptional repressor